MKNLVSSLVLSVAIFATTSAAHAGVTFTSERIEGIKINETEVSILLPATAVCTTDRKDCVTYSEYVTLADSPNRAFMLEFLTSAFIARKPISYELVMEAGGKKILISVGATLKE